MKFIILLSIISLGYGVKVKISVNRLREIADNVNSLKTTWTATDNFVSDEQYIDLSYTVGAFLRRPVKSKHTSNDQNEEDRAIQCEDNGLPENFDARKQWPNCTSIAHIYDQGNCGSCWAVSVVSAFTDRVCIQSNVTVKALRSAQQMTSCCHKCGYGCRGGWPWNAWDYLKREGAVTGGDYGSEEGCQPYLMRSCAHHVNGTKLPLCSSLPVKREPKCKLHCYNKKYTLLYKTDRVKAKNIREIDPCAAQNEIINHGPIIATFSVFEDFYVYKSGVYKYTMGRAVGHHAVRVIGWGVENGLPYWLVANSWNTNWGDKGIFKILRGDNEVAFEMEFSAADLDS